MTKTFYASQVVLQAIFLAILTATGNAPTAASLIPTMAVGSIVLAMSTLVMAVALAMANLVQMDTSLDLMTTRKRQS